MASRKPCIDCGMPVRASRCPNCAEKIIVITKPKDPTTSRGYGYQWQKLRVLILDRDGWTCYICQKKLTKADATVDHVVPLSVDRSASSMDPSNLRACCRSCNSRKKNK